MRHYRTYYKPRNRSIVRVLEFLVFERLLPVSSCITSRSIVFVTVNYRSEFIAVRKGFNFHGAGSS